MQAAQPAPQAPPPQLPPNPQGNDPLLRTQYFAQNRDAPGRAQAWGNTQVGGQMGMSGTRGMAQDAREAQAAGFGQYQNAISKGVGPGMGAQGGSSFVRGPNEHGVAAPSSAANGPNAVQRDMANGPSEAAIRAEMQRKKVGASLGPKNAALAGYMMG